MPVSSLREVTLGSADLPARVRQFAQGCGLSVLASGDVSPATAGRLFDNRAAPRAAVMGRPDVVGSTRLRLVDAGAIPPYRPGDLATPGPLGIGFTAFPVEGVLSRLERLGLPFVTPPLQSHQAVGAETDDALPDPRRFAASGRGSDGDLIVLTEGQDPARGPGAPDGDCSQPVHVSFVVSNLEACQHFMSDVLEHEAPSAQRCSGPPLDVLMGLGSRSSFRFAVSHRRDRAAAGTVFIEFAPRPGPTTQVPSLARGLCRLRYDTTDLYSTLARVPGGGGSLVRGPASVDDAVLGRGLVALVRAPFGVVVELWQTE